MVRKCSREGYPSQNIAKDRTVKCRQRDGTIHLRCYGIDKEVGEIFVINNIFILCDECITFDFEQPSPKRKGNDKNLIQRTIDVQNPTMALGSPTTEPVLTKSSVKSTQTLIESLARKLEINTNTIVALKGSVNAMNGTVNQQSQVSVEAIQVNNENISLIKMSLGQTRDLIQSIKEPTFANFLKNAKPIENHNGKETPKSSKPSRSVDYKNKTPSVSGTSTKVIGKPLSPIKNRPKIERKIPELAIWLGRLHRDTTEDEILAYIKNTLNIGNIDQLKIRKLVKKDRDLSEYSFVSFKIGCSAEMCGELLDVNKWPSTCQIREFKINDAPPEGARLNGKNSSKNEMSHPHESPTSQVEPTPHLKHEIQITD